MGEKAQKSHIPAIKDFARFLGHSPDTATPEELRAYQLPMTDTGVTASTFNVRIVALRFFFGMNLVYAVYVRKVLVFRLAPRTVAALDNLATLRNKGTVGILREHGC
ncbi:phage integrase N-terminal SAM-like domain-containing protein [Mameliella sp. CS4]|uniref:phage integrase N-terminal SAM-like domain-containing protein n=1 Tax=Mameliella sp. CS4 TaxID=2862329 RepID=UPI00351D9EFB